MGALGTVATQRGVAVVAGDLLDDVDLGFDSRTATTGSSTSQVFAGRRGGEPDRIEQLGDAVGGELGAEQRGPP